MTNDDRSMLWVTMLVNGLQNYHRLFSVYYLYLDALGFDAHSDFVNEDGEARLQLALPHFEGLAYWMEVPNYPIWILGKMKIGGVFAHCYPRTNEWYLNLLAKTPPGKALNPERVAAYMISRPEEMRLAKMKVNDRIKRKRSTRLETRAERFAAKATYRQQCEPDNWGTVKGSSKTRTSRSRAR